MKPVSPPLAAAPLAMMLIAIAPGAMAQALPAASPAQAVAPAQNPPPPADGEVSVNGDPILTANRDGLDKDGDILVVAKRIKGQVVTDLPPIITLDEDDIAAYGVSSIQELVAALVPQTGTGRGRGAGTPAFLLNGMRISSFREMRGLPPEAIRRVEILPEEVALKFGFRPDQRVVNFILKDKYHSLFAEAEISLPGEGGYHDWREEATLTRIEQGARINVTGSHETSSPLTEAARGIVQAMLPAPGAPNPADYRTLEPQTTATSLNATVAKPLPQGAGLTINALIERDSNDALNGIRATEPTVALQSTTRSTTASLGLGLNKPLGKWLLSATLDASHVASQIATDTLASPVAALADSKTDTATSLVTVSGSPLALRAGNAALTLKTGYVWSAIASSSTRTGMDTRLRRGDAQVGFSLDVPLTSRKDHVLAAIGDLSLNLNGEAHSLSDFGGLVDLGAGLTWKPLAFWTLSSSYIGTEVAPGLSNLGGPQVVTPGVAVFDFVRGQTVLATVTTGGNRALLRENQHDLKFASEWTLPFGGGNNSVLVEYFRNHADNPTSNFPLATAPVQAAFAGRIVRNGAGQIVAIDETPVTLAMTRSSRIRTSLNLGGAFGKPDPELAKRRAGFGLRGGGGGGGGPGGPGRGGPGGGRGPGGFGGGQGGPGGGDGRGRWNMSLSYSYELVNTAQLVPGGAVLDQLRGDAVTGAGVARHSATLEGGGFYHGIGLRLNASYAGATHVSASGAPGSLPLDFGSLTTVNMRLFVDLARAIPATAKSPLLKGARLSLAVTNLFDQRQNVVDSTGATPLRYQPGYIDPIGRLFKLQLRKQF